jgi:hypothetical protein
MLSPVYPLLSHAAAGLSALPSGLAVSPALGLAGLALAAGFALLVGLLLAAPLPDGAEEAWAEVLDRRVAFICATAFALMGVLCGGLAWAIWAQQGPGGALGLSATGFAFVTAALAFGGHAMHRR